MEEWEEKEPTRTCLVCGHPMGALDRICDHCGSIRRPAKPGGKKTPREEHSTCARCGEKIPQGREYCAECAAHVEAHARAQKKQSSKKRPFFAVLWHAILRLFGRGE